MNNNDKKIEELFDAGCHLGHKKNRVHPQAKKYIYSFENGVSIIDLTYTVDLLEKAKQFISQLIKSNKTILFVSTKKVSLNLINSLCQANNIPNVTLKWPAGLLTNFEMIMKNVKKLVTMKEEKEKGEWNKFVKHEQIKLQKKLFKLEKFYGGIIALKKLPDALFVIDVKKEKNAVKEATEMNIPVIAITDTNVDPATVNYPIPANDDSASSIEYLVKEITEAYTKNKS
ncbi:30S ribosomal protein S2 [Candidatus Roizmanbacteria bacterium CG22_combo_CG10-13_8_21_14_all_35_9]|uniref:Small ribosomal subunit protein uS2 n=4 Tax=Candidatus Roizmaniibacteriota TaxID=1752723 RepID=A0A2M8F3Z7_9BACT|nr:MAG: 30S ribosomal protein S2 [Candidatus Roizmanbacteria bacterium CG23_combo_of_CG06-09_8_20_14_all_35_49]PIP63081.1 MAG: 30S ribosomal protein S2 [Candidatus Roizmanbacteria bacterium CG22_combo_CG10-13_8_21_14_all_35_9]PIY70828.1 MAG: 30S ribosomal protein S2 [Candidatus Roizmanbacteria bacterium CG_4_10_14_0_8_um_filter_35_28]PJC34033.1 MAG: 30S ribosomal protein S2 [Candidatus Roizmanbacteria bacterium CG_4_9_14_0_2_um_filter_35_15]PJC82479.1 MAG: 30S ribosomal protein S2 [Candidatus R